MHLLTKTALIISTAGLLLAAPPSRAINQDDYQCWVEFRDCMSAGYDADFCRDNYYLCRYGYLPVKTAAGSIAMDRRR